MSTNLEYFNDLKEWSKRKLDLVRKYLDGASKILGSIDVVYYIDGFAGRGSYGSEADGLIPGSPLQAARLAQDSKSYSLRCINIEKDPDVFAALERELKPYQGFVTNINGEFSQHIGQILTLVGNKPVVCFLDPFGIDGIDWSAVSKLIRRRGITDFWVRFDVSELRRRAGYYNSNLAGADKQFDILCRVYGVDDKDTLYQQLDGYDPKMRKDNALNFYMKRLEEEFSSVRGQGYTAAYRIGSLKEETKYYLVFATADLKGLVLANNIVCDVEEVYQKEVERYKSSRTPQLSMFSFIDPSEEEILRSKVDQLKDAIWDSCQGQTLTRLQIYGSVMDEWFGVIKSKHMTRAIKELKDEGKIIDLQGNPSNDKSIAKFAS